jgi:hypothetical protein
MKTMKYMIVGILLASLIPQVKAGDPVWETKMKTPKTEVKMFAMDFTAPIPVSSAAFDKCRKYKGKQVAGFVMLPVSLGLMAGGGYLIYSGAKNIADKTNVGFEGVSTDVSKDDKTKIGIGAGMAFVGAVLFPTGLILGIKGGTNYNRDCRGGPGTAQRSLNIRPTGNGINMALKF